MTRDEAKCDLEDSTLYWVRHILDAGLYLTSVGK